MLYDKADGNWWTEYADTISPAYLSFIQEEQRASRIKSFSQSVVPGLLQTESYARTVAKTTVLHAQHPGKINRMVRIRMQRQWQLFERPDPVRLSFVIDQSVLYRHVCGADQLHEQLMHLKHIARLPFVSFRVLPFAHDGQGQFFFDNFSLITVAGDDSLYVENMATGMTRHASVDMAVQYENLFDRLSLSSLNPEASVAIITKALSQLESGIQPQS